MGINLFKIDGRDKEPRYIKTVIKADWHVGIDNRDLDGFSDAFFSGKINCKGNCANCRYCEKFANKVVIDPTWQRKIVKVMKYNLEKYYGKKL